MAKGGKKRGRKRAVVRLETPFAARLRALRMSQDGEPDMGEFARMLSVEGETYRRWERSETEPNIATLNRIRKITGCDLNWLIGPERTEDRAHVPSEERAARA
jgi:transcriptional regulator with XRE-family HTH domain